MAGYLPICIYCNASCGYDFLPVEVLLVHVGMDAAPAENQQQGHLHCIRAHRQVLQAIAALCADVDALASAWVFQFRPSVRLVYNGCEWCCPCLYHGRGAYVFTLLQVLLSLGNNCEYLQCCTFTFVYGIYLRSLSLASFS